MERCWNEPGPTGGLVGGPYGAVALKQWERNCNNVVTLLTGGIIKKQAFHSVLT